VLARHTQQLAARHQQVQVRAGGEQPRELRRGRDHVLHVVDHNQRGAVADEL
jgi:hypothetical protein